MEEFKQALIANVALYNSATKLKIHSWDGRAAVRPMARLEASHIAKEINDKLDKLERGFTEGIDSDCSQRLFAMLQHLSVLGGWPLLSFCMLTCKLEDMYTMEYNGDTMEYWHVHNDGQGGTGSLIPDALNMQLESRKDEATHKRIMDQMATSGEQIGSKRGSSSRRSESPIAKALRSTSDLAKHFRSSSGSRTRNV